LKEWTTPELRNTPSTTNLEEQEIVDALGNDGKASMPEQVNRPNPWRKMMMLNFCLLLSDYTYLNIHKNFISSNIYDIAVFKLHPQCHETRGLGGGSTSYRCPAVRKGARGPNALHMFVSFSVILLFVECANEPSQKKPISG